MPYVFWYVFLFFKNKQLILVASDVANVLIKIDIPSNDRLIEFDRVKLKIRILTITKTESNFSNTLTSMLATIKIWLF